MEAYKERNTSNGNILRLLLILTVTSQFDGASFEGIAKIVMYAVWCAVFIIYSLTLKYIDRTPYVLVGMSVATLLIVQYTVASIIIDNYRPPIIAPFITSVLFYIVGILFCNKGLNSRDLQTALKAYCIICIFLGIYIWTKYYGSLSVWLNIDQNLYPKKNSAGQILAVGTIISFFYIKTESKIEKLINIAIGLGLIFIIMIIHCRTALLAFCMTVLVHLFLLTTKKQKQIIIALIPILVLIVYNVPFLRGIVNQALYIDKYTVASEFTLNSFLSNRLDWFSAAYDKFVQSPVTILFGLGRSYVDNLFVNVLTSTGVIGLLVIAFAYAKRFIINFKLPTTNDEYRLLKMISVFYIVESLAEGLPPYGPGACAVIFWFICGYCDVLNRRLLYKVDTNKAD